MDHAVFGPPELRKTSYETWSEINLVENGDQCLGFLKFEQESNKLISGGSDSENLKDSSHAAAAQSAGLHLYSSVAVFCAC